MCEHDRFLLENEKNTDSTAKVRCVKRCPVFYKGVPFDKVPQDKLDKFRGETGNEDPDDALLNNLKQREEYFELKEMEEKGLLSEDEITEMDTLRNALSRRRLLQLLEGGERTTDTGGEMLEGQEERTEWVVDEEDAELQDLTQGQPDDRDVTDFVKFKGICKPCDNNCDGGCAEGWFYRKGQCVERCDKSREVAKVLDNFSVCVCPKGTYRDRETQDCLACQSGCAKCQAADKCEACDSGSFLQVNPGDKTRSCVSSCAAGFEPQPWEELDTKIKEIYTVDKTIKTQKALEEEERLAREGENRLL